MPHSFWFKCQNHNSFVLRLTRLRRQKKNQPGSTRDSRSAGRGPASIRWDSAGRCLGLFLRCSNVWRLNLLYGRNRRTCLNRSEYAWRFPWGRGSGVVYRHFWLASSLPIVTRRRMIAPSYRPVDCSIAQSKTALPSSTCLYFQHWESFSSSLLKPARLSKVSAFRRVGIQAINILQKKMESSKGRETSNFGSNSLKYCG